MFLQTFATKPPGWLRKDSSSRLCSQCRTNRGAVLQSKDSEKTPYSFRSTRAGARNTLRIVARSAPASPEWVNNAPSPQRNSFSAIAAFAGVEHTPPIATLVKPATSNPFTFK